jgi:phosphoglycolate phosphatase-like HAD superfamily hydrolase
MDTVVLDIDGTLLDSTYLHATAWSRAFQAHGVHPPLWRIHRAIGMGGDRLVAAVAGDEVEKRAGDGIRDRWEQEYDAVIDQTRLLDGAALLLDACRERGLAVALASSSIPKHARYALDLLDAQRRAHGWTTADDAEESKPDPELIDAALERVGGGAAVVIGDTVWDVQAARRAGLPAICLLSGGISRGELEEAGAVAVYEDPCDLLRHLDEALTLADRA